MDNLIVDLNVTYNNLLKKLKMNFLSSFFVFFVVFIIVFIIVGHLTGATESQSLSALNPIKNLAPAKYIVIAAMYISLIVSIKTIILKYKNFQELKKKRDFFINYETNYYLNFLSQRCYQIIVGKLNVYWFLFFCTGVSFLVVVYLFIVCVILKYLPPLSSSHASNITIIASPENWFKAATKTDMKILQYSSGVFVGTIILSFLNYLMNIKKIKNIEKIIHFSNNALIVYSLDKKIKKSNGRRKRVVFVLLCVFGFAIYMVFKKVIVAVFKKS